MPDILAPGQERFRRLSKEGAWIVLGQASAVLGSLAGVRLLTELLDPAAYGELALGMTVASLVNQTVLGPLSNGITRFYAPAQERGDLASYLSAVRGLVLAASAVIAIMILLAAAGLLIAGRKEWIAIAGAALVLAGLSGCNAILSGIQNAARQRAIVALHQGIEPWARFLLAAALLLWLGATSTVAMAGYALAVTLVLGSQYVFFRKVIHVNGAVADRSSWRRQIWTYSWPISIFGTFTWMQLASDRWALERFATTQEVGLYAALFQLGYYPMSIATGMAVQFLVPIFYQRAGDASDYQRNAGVDSLSWRLTGIALGLTGAFFLAALLFHAQIFRLLVAAEYASVSHLLPWMLLSGGVFAAGQTIALNLMSQMKTQIMIAPKLITALLGVALNFALAYWYGISGIVIAGMLFSVAYFVWMAVLAKRQGINFRIDDATKES
ncbi:MAG: lipopolysaccharide biosynthesis protein [Betaproteobacteria bacterium]|nr:lipopolysaccharide biosynthesis protein [Betaproteobacteria bacterium]